jgi:hypothetical protein
MYNRLEFPGVQYLNLQSPSLRFYILHFANPLISARKGNVYDVQC